jgi:nucleotide-binding universal stress UspA family protein
MSKQDYFKNILLPVDGSTSCIHAKLLTALIAKKFQSKVTVVNVVSHNFMHPELKANYQLPSEVLDKLDNVYSDVGNKYLRQAKELFEEEHIDVSSELVKAEDSAEAIIEMVKERNYDLVVIGNRGPKSERFALGPVAEKVSMYASCPVLISKGKPTLKKLLVAVDGSNQSNKAVDYAVELAKKFDAKLTLLHVEEKKLFKLERDLSQKIGEQFLLDAERRMDDVEYEKKMIAGNPWEIILDMAKAGNFDLVVMGSRGLSSVKRFLLGSVSAEVSMLVQSSVLLIR